MAEDNKDIFKDIFKDILKDIFKDIYVIVAVGKYGAEVRGAFRNYLQARQELLETLENDYQGLTELVNSMPDNEERQQRLLKRFHCIHFVEEPEKEQCCWVNFDEDYT